jgi:lactaldehyde reductase
MPHGKACATLLPAVMAFNADYTGTKYRDIAIAMGVEGVENMTQDEYRAAAVEAVRKLAEDVGIVTSLKGVVKEEDIDALALDAYNDACRPGNPREVSVEDIIAIYRSLM